MLPFVGGLIAQADTVLTRLEGSCRSDSLASHKCTTAIECRGFESILHVVVVKATIGCLIQLLLQQHKNEAAIFLVAGLALLEKIVAFVVDVDLADPQDQEAAYSECHEQFYHR